MNDLRSDSAPLCWRAQAGRVIDAAYKNASRILRSFKMAEQAKKPQGAKKPVPAAKPAVSKHAAPKPATPTSGSCGSPASKPPVPNSGQK